MGMEEEISCGPCEEEGATRPRPELQEDRRAMVSGARRGGKG